MASHENLGLTAEEFAIDSDKFNNAVNVHTELTRLESIVRNEILPDQSREMGIFSVLEATFALGLPEDKLPEVHNLLLQAHAIGAAEAVARNQGTLLVIPTTTIRKEGEI